MRQTENLVRKAVVSMTGLRGRGGSSVRLTLDAGVARARPGEAGAGRRSSDAQERAKSVRRARVEQGATAPRLREGGRGRRFGSTVVAFVQQIFGLSHLQAGLGSVRVNAAPLRRGGVWPCSSLPDGRPALLRLPAAHAAGARLARGATNRKSGAVSPNSSTHGRAVGRCGGRPAAAGRAAPSRSAASATDRRRRRTGAGDIRPQTPLGCACACGGAGAAAGGGVRRRCSRHRCAMPSAGT